MKALVYHGPGTISWEAVPDPKIEADTDAIVQVDATTICGSDLHIVKGDLPEVTDGRILGHEAVGTVTEIGPGVTTVKVGDRVLVSCITTPTLMRLVASGQVDPSPFATHRFTLDHILERVRRVHPRQRHRRPQSRHHPNLTHKENNR